MTLPSIHGFDSAESIPQALKALDRWAPWAAVWNPKRGKYDKIPKQCGNPEWGVSTTKPDKWFSFDQARKALARHPKQLAGLGVCVTGLADIIAVDLDGCVDADGYLDEFAQQIMSALPSYTEISPSGRGLRIMGWGAIDFDWTNHERGIEVYGGNGARFLTITGNHLAGAPADLMPLDPFALEDLAAQFAKTRERATVIDLTMPDVAQGATHAGLELPPKVMRFLSEGDPGEDRSGTLHAAGVALYSLGLDDAAVLSILAGNEHAMAVALDHRRQDSDRAMMYLWREHCLKAKGKASSAVATLDEFESVVKPDEPKPLPAFKRDKNGAIEATVDNVTMAVRRPDVCGVEIGFDTFRDEIMFTEPGKVQWRPFSDPDYVRIRIRLERGGFKPIGRELVRDVVLLVADEQRFDSAMMWLDGLKWDGKPRVEGFLRDYFSVADSPYTRAVSRYLWSAMAGRVVTPGCKADMVPILVGAQGAGKSTAVAAMVPSPEFFAEISFNEKDEDLARKMRGRLVAEIGELRGLHTKELETIKAFITRTHENWIPKYREFAVQFPRRLVFIGTTNKDEFLADETGNRRWLPVSVGKVNTDAIRRDRLQLWAEARELFAVLGVDFREAETLAVEVHEQHTMEDAWTDVIERWLDEPEALTDISPLARGFVRIEDVLKGALRVDEKNFTRKDELRVGAILRKLGWARRKPRIEGKGRWGYVPLVDGETH